MQKSKINHDFLAGVKVVAPPGFGCVPVGVSIGLLASGVGMSKVEVILMSVLVMAGASELMAIGMMTADASVVAIILGTFFLNLRHFVMSASAWKNIEKVGLGRKMLGSFALCDESFAVFSLSKVKNYSFFLGANTAMFLFFVLSTVAGCFMADVLPEIIIDSFGIAFYAAFLALLIPSIKGNNRIILMVLLTALLNWGLGQMIPSSWAIIVSMMIGALIGVYLIPDSIESEVGA